MVKGSGFRAERQPISVCTDLHVEGWVQGLMYTPSFKGTKY